MDWHEMRWGTRVSGAAGVRAFVAGAGVACAVCSMLVLAIAGPLASQENGPIGILRGDLVAWSGAPRAGTLTFRNADNRLVQCSFDDKTWFERENEHIAVSGIRAGDHLEIVADHKPASAVCYARTVKILDMLLARRTAAGKPRLSSHNNATELLAPRGDITFSGLVMSIDGNWLMLRTRDKGTRQLLLRPDTRFLGAGLAQERSNLPIQTLVFIRAGRNLDGDVEAYTIVWGDILQVRD